MKSSRSPSTPRLPGPLARQGQGRRAQGRSLRGGQHAAAADDGLRRSRQTVGLRAPPCVVIQRRDGTLIDARDDPERSFDGHQLESPWDNIHLAYFSGEALWTYLNTPFLYAWPGFVTEEIAPIEVDGETWRRLKVTFPDHIKSHTRQQISCFGPDGLLRRSDFTIDVIGGATGLVYATDYRDVDGIIIPTARRGYAWQGDYQLVPEPLLVAIDMGEITIR
jgi:hypothetical protein